MRIERNTVISIRGYPNPSGRLHPRSSIREIKYQRQGYITPDTPIRRQRDRRRSYPSFPSFFRSVHIDFDAAVVAAAAADSAIIWRDKTIVLPTVILRNYSSLRSCPNARYLWICLQTPFRHDFPT